MTSSWKIHINLVSPSAISQAYKHNIRAQSGVLDPEGRSKRKHVHVHCFVCGGNACCICEIAGKSLHYHPPKHILAKHHLLIFKGRLLLYWFFDDQTRHPFILLPISSTSSPAWFCPPRSSGLGREQDIRQGSDPECVWAQWRQWSGCDSRQVPHSSQDRHRQVRKISTDV